MAARYLPRQAPTDRWALREKLALACSVKRSGDNNWVSVSRAIKPYGESNRPSDWFSQRNCALQYSDLLDKVETPKRKRGEKESATTESPGDIIIRKMTIERIEELKRFVEEEEARYRRLKEDVTRMLSGEADDELHAMQQQIDSEKKEKEEKEKKWTDELVAREEKLRNRKMSMGLKVKVDIDDSSQETPSVNVPLEEDSNLSQNSVSTTLSTSSQDVKPQVSVTEFGDTNIKQELNLIAAGDIKLEPVEPVGTGVEATVKEEPTEAGDGNDIKFTMDGRSEDTGKSESKSAAKVVESELTDAAKMGVCVVQNENDSQVEPDPQEKTDSSETEHEKTNKKESKSPEKESAVDKKNKISEKAPESKKNKKGSDIAKKIKTPEKELSIAQKNKTPEKETGIAKEKTPEKNSTPQLGIAKKNKTPEKIKISEKESDTNKFKTPEKELPNVRKNNTPDKESRGNSKESIPKKKKVPTATLR